MREFTFISTSIWNSRKFSCLQSDDAKLLYFYLLTCPSMNSLGCYVLKPGYAAADLGWDAIRYKNGINALLEASLIGVDKAENLIRIVGFLQHSEIMNAKHGAGAVKIAMALPDCSEKLLLLKDLAAQKHVKADGLEAAIRRFSSAETIPYPNGIDTPIPIPIPIPIDSDAIASGDASAAADPVKAVFDAGLSVLVGRGVTPDAARRFVGKLRKDHPGQDGQILAAIMDCGKAGAVDPIPWITAVLSKPKTPTVAEIMAKIAAEERLQ